MRFKRSVGITPSEKLLADLCDNSFLTLWSYPNLYRKPGKELCDLMVVFGDSVIIFSDKSCGYPNSGDPQLDWSRWYRRSIADSAHQLRRAESWLRKYSDRVFLDAKCAEVLPVQLPPTDRIQVHRVCIALGASERSKAETGKNSLTVSAVVEGDAQCFTVGHVNQQWGWVHVIDDETLPVVLNELSTVMDFLDYLRKKERLIESGKFVYAESELDLLAYFLWNNREFPFPDAGCFKLDPNLWQKVEADPDFLAGREANKASYFWDGLIEYLTDLYMKEELEFGNEIPVGDYERMARIMAAENRFGRRILAKWILKRAVLSRDEYVGSILQSLQREVLYVLLIGPGDRGEEHALYRRKRSEQLYDRCIAAKAAQLDRRYIIGIAMDARGVRGSSEDFIYMDTADWTEEAIQKAEELRQELGYFVEGKALKRHVSESEYPAS